MHRFNIAVVLALTVCLVSAPNVDAGYFNTQAELDAWKASNPGDFALIGTAWNPGTNSARIGGHPAPGAANWSVLPVGVADSIADDHSPAGGGNTFTTALSALYAGGVDEITTIGLTLDKWAAVSGFTNLGMVADPGVGFPFGSIGATGADIRVGAIFIDGAAGANVLAHAFGPGTPALFGTTNGGDTHFDNANTWGDTPVAVPGVVDYHTVALHELGHALGLGHSAVVGSVMEPIYAGPRRTLTADDIAGIQAIYGAAPAIPEPSMVAFWTFGLCVLGTRAGLMRLRRKKETDGE